MAVTALPTPGVTPPNWGQQLNDAITSRYDDRVAVDDELQELIPAGVELASAEVAYSFATTFAVFNATAAAVVGAMIIVPPTVGPVRLEYGGDVLITTAGAGLLQIQVWEGVGSFTVPTFTSMPTTAANVSIFAGYSGNGFPMRGVRRLDPSAVDRTFFLAATLYRDGGSGLTAALPNTPENPSYIRAYAA